VLARTRRAPTAPDLGDAPEAELASDAPGDTPIDVAADLADGEAGDARDGGALDADASDLSAAAYRAERLVVRLAGHTQVARTARPSPSTSGGGYCP
jgi:hypothetical protein